MSDWDHPFSKEEVTGWKKQHGENNIHLVMIEDDTYVIRGLGRAEFHELSDNEFRNDEHMEDTFAQACTLYPELNEVDLRNLPGGVSNNLFDTCMEKSNIEAWRDKEIEKLETDYSKAGADLANLVEKELKSKELKAEDIPAILSNAKNQGRVYITEFEGRLFIYKGLSRSEFERLRTEQRDGKYQGPQSEEELCNRCILYPFQFNATGDQWLHGTVSSLSLMVMRVSGFGATKEVVTL